MTSGSTSLLILKSSPSLVGMMTTTPFSDCQTLDPVGDPETSAIVGNFLFSSLSTKSLSLARYFVLKLTGSLRSKPELTTRCQSGKLPSTTGSLVATLSPSLSAWTRYSCCGKGSMVPSAEASISTKSTLLESVFFNCVKTGLSFLEFS